MLEIAEPGLDQLQLFGIKYVFAHELFIANQKILAEVLGSGLKLQPRERLAYFRIAKIARDFVGKIAHEKLFDLKTARVPPRSSREKRVRARAASEPGCLRV